jgi:hypothetical protein
MFGPGTRTLVLKPAMAALTQAIGGDPDNGMDNQGQNLYMMSLPLADVLAFAGDAVAGDPDAVVARLLEEVRG